MLDTCCPCPLLIHTWTKDWLKRTSDTLLSICHVHVQAARFPCRDFHLSNILKTRHKYCVKRAMLLCVCVCVCVTWKSLASIIEASCVCEATWLCCCSCCNSGFTSGQDSWSSPHVEAHTRYKQTVIFCQMTTGCFISLAFIQTLLMRPRCCSANGNEWNRHGCNNNNNKNKKLCIDTTEWQTHLVEHFLLGENLIWMGVIPYTFFLSVSHKAAKMLLT